jgi:hypothetical protein
MRRTFSDRRDDCKQHDEAGCIATICGATRGTCVTWRRRAAWSVDRTWDGEPVAADERVEIRLVVGDEKLRVEVDAPCHDDAAPPGPPGAFDGLWRFEVVELFLLGADDRYLEIELAPSGHHLVLALHGARRRVDGPLPAQAHCERHGERWQGTIELDAGLLPLETSRANAHAIHGRGARRRHLAAHPTGGDEPDFHRLDRFPSIVWLDERGGA